MSIVPELPAVRPDRQLAELGPEAAESKQPATESDPLPACTENGETEDERLDLGSPAREVELREHLEDPVAQQRRAPWWSPGTFSGALLIATAGGLIAFGIGLAIDWAIRA